MGFTVGAIEIGAFVSASTGCCVGPVDEGGDTGELVVLPPIVG